MPTEASLSLTTPLDLDAYARDGYLVVPEFFSGERLADLRRFAVELEAAPPTSDAILQYDETLPDGTTARCRTENFIPHHDGLAALLADGAIPDAVGALFGEPAVLYKEKLNYKAPGGSGFAPHHDAAAYPNVSHTIACLVAVDDFTRANGCLEVAAGAHRDKLPTEHGGNIAVAALRDLTWTPLDIPAGSVAFFHCYLPHRSGPNGTPHTRRAIFLTFNPASEGNLREAYYAGKLDALKNRPDRLSLIDAFTGEVTAMAPSDTSPGTSPTAESDVVPLSHLTPGDHTPDQAVAELERLFATRGNSRYDEVVTQNAHAFQCADLAAQADEPLFMQLACLLHDIGHLMLGEYKDSGSFLTKDLRHEDVSDAFLRTWFGDQVAEPVRLHVASKRYLVAVDPSYASTLSASSTRSLRLQGGPMNDAEITAFEANPHYENAVRLRRYDDLAKVVDAASSTFDDWRDALVQHMETTVDRS